MLQVPTHCSPDNVLLQYFYQILDRISKGVTNQVSSRDLMKQPYVSESLLLDIMTMIIRDGIPAMTKSLPSL